jgi:hypothetical protein
MTGHLDQIASRLPLLDMAITAACRAARWDGPHIAAMIDDRTRAALYLHENGRTPPAHYATPDHLRTAP